MRLKKHVLTQKIVILVLFVFIVPVYAEDWPKINRYDLSANIGDYQFNALTKEYGTENFINTKCPNAQCFSGYVSDLSGMRVFGVDTSGRISINKLGAKSDLAHLFYLVLDMNFAGNTYFNHANKKQQIINVGAGASAGFVYPLLSAIGTNKYLVANKSEPVNLNIFAELGLGYGLNINSGIEQAIEHTINPILSLGMNLSFKDVPELELEVAYKLMPGWRNNLYLRAEYDFISYMGFYLALDALYGALNTGLTFRF